jgi:hypothetical protein
MMVKLTSGVEVKVEHICQIQTNLSAAQASLGETVL